MLRLRRLLSVLQRGVSCVQRPWLDGGAVADDQNNKIEQCRRRAAMFDQCAKEAKNSDARCSFEQLAREWQRELTAEQGAGLARADGTGP